MCSFINHTDVSTDHPKSYLQPSHILQSPRLPCMRHQKNFNHACRKTTMIKHLVLEVTTESNTSCTKSRFGTVGPFVSALLPLMTPIKCTIKKPFLVAGEASFTQVRTFYTSQVAAFIPILNSKTCGPPASHGEQWKHLPKNIPLSVWAQWAWLLSYTSRTNKSEFVWSNMAPAYKTCLTVFISNVKRFRENVMNTIVEPPNNTFSFHT